MSTNCNSVELTAIELKSKNLRYLFEIIGDVSKEKLNHQVKTMKNHEETAVFKESIFSWFHFHFCTA